MWCSTGIGGKKLWYSQQFFHRQIRTASKVKKLTPDKIVNIIRLCFFTFSLCSFFVGWKICKKFQRLPKIGRNYGSMSVRMCTFTCVESDVITNFIPIKIKHLRSGEKNQSTEGKNVRNLIENYIFLVGLWQAGVTRVNRFLWIGLIFYLNSFFLQILLSNYCLFMANQIDLLRQMQ